MSVLQESRALEIGEAVCRKAGDVPVQATVLLGRNRLTRLGGGVVLHHAEVEDAKVIVRALVGGGEGVAFSNDLSDAGLERVAKQAIETARLAPNLDGRPSLPNEADAGELQGEEIWDEATVEGDPEHEESQLAGALDAAREHHAALAGILCRRGGVRAIVNTSGLRRSGRSTSAYVRFIASCGEGSGHGGALVNRSSDLDLPRLAGHAAAVAYAARAPKSLPAGRYDVVLEPEAVIELLEWFSGIAFGARAWEEGRSFLKGRLGEKVTGSKVSMYDPGPEAQIVPVSFDREGVSRRRVDFIVNGCAGDVVHDRHSAKRNGCSSTGHWAIDERFPVDGPTPGAVVMAAGNDSGDLLDGLDYGLHVHRFHYVNGRLDPQKARMTGLTRDGVFEVRDGQLGEAVRDLRFTENLLEAFERIDGLGDQLHSVATFWSEHGGAYAAPRLRIRDFTFTGTCER
ncbi:MAG: metallopeptidase TldD-related protein [Myxococcota bacterium]|nr:metallopeptidase TldD-related protein [Myxococcota bacterium]